MSDLKFSWQGPGSLAKQVSLGLRRATLRTAAHGRPIAVTLWQGDQSGLRIESTMHQLAERIEVGVLAFSVVHGTKSDETSIDLNPGFEGPIEVKKLVINESGTNAESGLLLEAAGGQRIVIVAGVFPYTLAVEGITTIPHAFEPEYPLDRYIRMPL